MSSRGGWWRSFPTVVLLLCALSLTLIGPVPGQSQTQIEGEYGLYVTDDGEWLGVGWLTEGAEPGRLEVLSGGSLIYEEETPASGSHFVRFPRPEADVILRYGSSERRFETPIRLGPSPAPVAVLSGIESLFVVGDIHGEYDRLLGLLQNAGLVGPEGDWTGGRSHVVFLGDIFDRGADVTKTLWFLYRLELQARRAEGGAHVVLGNHEAMIFTEDTRYVSAKENLVARLHGVSYPELFDIRNSLLGRWLAGRPGAMRIDGALLAHGGIAPDLEPRSVPAINDSIRAFLSEDLFYRWADTTLAVVTDSATALTVRDQYADVLLIDPAALARRGALLFDERSILWFRGYVEADTLGSGLEQVLEEFGADVHIVGHTPVPSITSRYDGTLLAVDLIDAATEMLLLRRDSEEEGYRRFRIGLEGPSQPF
jgi:hypothetical protein